MTISDRAICCAQQYLGKKEEKKNDAQWLRSLMAAGGNPARWTPGAAYCIAALLALFGTACKVAGKNFPIKPSASTQTFFANAHEFKLTGLNPAVGDIVIFQLGHSWQGHAGLVTQVLRTDKGVPYGIHTIEFNTSSGEKGSQRDGEGCYEKIRLFEHYTPTKERRLWIKGFVKTSTL